MLVLMCYLIIMAAAFVLTRVRPIYGLSALVLATPFDLSAAIGPTTATIPKAVLLAVCAALASRGQLHMRELCRAPLFLAAVCIVLATAATALGAIYHLAVLRETLKAVLYLLTLCVAYWCYRSDPDTALLRRAICAVTVVVATCAIAQEWTGAPSVFRAGQHLVPRIAGPLEGPNQLAGFFDITLSWLLAQTLFLNTTRKRAPPFALALGYIALFLTFSRGGIVAVSVTTLVLIAARRAWAAPIALVWLASSICGLLLDIALARGGAHLFSVTDTGDTGALGHRSELWRAAIFFWWHHPLLGIGAGNYEHELALAGYPKLRDHANSLYLQSLAEGGVVLFGAVVALFATITRTLRRSFAHSPLAAGALAATLAFALHQSVDFLAFYPKVATLWWVILGVALADRMGVAAPAAKHTE